MKYSIDHCSGVAGDDGRVPVPADPDPAPRYLCELCGAAMYEHNCKIVCPNCGYKRDCSDP